MNPGSLSCGALTTSEERRLSVSKFLQEIRNQFLSSLDEREILG